jgi:hypothetical protein
LTLEQNTNYFEAILKDKLTILELTFLKKNPLKPRLVLIKVTWSLNVFDKLFSRVIKVNAAA